MSASEVTCSICRTAFTPTFAYQIQRSDAGVLHFCGQTCHEEHMMAAHQASCDTCGTSFVPEYAFQRATVDGETRQFCRVECRDASLDSVARRSETTQRIAVLNQKGGTGKTTTSVNVAAGLADAGYRTLLVDLDTQGHVAESLGLKSRYTLYHVLVEDVHPADAIINVGPGFDAITSSRILAKAEMRLVNRHNPHQLLEQRMRSVRNYDFVLMDCGPSLSLLNQNALAYADHIVIPVSCDYLSLVGVKQILQTLKKVNELLLEPVNILGVVPTFYDVRTRASIEAVATLEAYFKERVLPPIRVNTRIKEAPSHKQTIFEYAPDSRGAADYRDMVVKLIERLNAHVPAVPEVVMPVEPRPEVSSV